jgi:predicted branched-subunit amino acid permease
MNTMSAPGTSISRAVRDAAPVALAYAPFGLALGATLAATHLPPLIAWSSSPLLFGGAAQLLAVQLLNAGASGVVVVLAALVVNARMLLYSGALAPHTVDWPARWRWWGAYLLTDPVYALAINRFQAPDGGGSARDRRRYYLAVGLTLWTAWMTLTAAGVLLGGVLPRSLPLDLAAPLTFLLLLLPMLTSRPAYAAATTGGLIALAASGLPLGLGLLAGAAAGITAGRLLETRRPSRSSRG